MALLMFFSHATTKLISGFQVSKFAFLKNCFQTIRSREKAYQFTWARFARMQPQPNPNATQVEAVCTGLENRMSIFDSFHGTLELGCWKSSIWAGSCQVHWVVREVPFAELAFDDVADKRGPVADSPVNGLICKRE